MNKLIHILICCILLSLTWACNDEENNSPAGGKIEVSLGSKEFRTLENITPLQIAVALSSPAQQDVTVTGYIKSEANAKEGVDYSFISKKIVIPAGKTTGYFEVEIKDYPVYTPDRNFVFEIVNVEGASRSLPDVCQVIITSNEGLPVIGFVNTLQSVDEEYSAAEVAVGLNHSWDKDISFRIRPLPAKSTAVFGEHYQLDTTSLYTIKAGESSVVIPVTIIDDIIENDDRYFELEVHGNTGSVLSEVLRTMKVTIVNDEEPVYVCFERTAVKATESEGPVWIPIRIKGNPKTPVKVRLESRGGKAVEGTDYVFTDRELVFPVGMKLDSVPVKFIDNDKNDMDRSFTIGFASVEGAQLASSDTLINVTIQNDDFDKTQLYDDLMGEWTLHNKFNEGDKVKEAVSLVISGGDNPAEEDANYLKRLVCRASGYVWGKDFTFYLNYDANTGELSLQLLDICMTEDFGGNWGKCNLRLEAESNRALTTWPVSHSKDYKTLTLDPSTLIAAILYKFDTNERFNVVHFKLTQAYMTKSDN